MAGGGGDTGNPSNNPALGVVTDYQYSRRIKKKKKKNNRLSALRKLVFRGKNG